MGHVADAPAESTCIIVAQPLVEQNSRLLDAVRRIRRRAEASWPKLWV
jgi:hypothetical protein